MEDSEEEVFGFYKVFVSRRRHDVELRRVEGAKATLKVKAAEAGLQGRGGAVQLAYGMSITARSLYSPSYGPPHSNLDARVTAQRGAVIPQILSVDTLIWCTSKASLG